MTTTTMTPKSTSAASPTPAHPTLLARLADWSYRRRRRVLVLWIVLLFGTVFLAKAAGGEYHFTFTTPGAESQKAQDLLASSFLARAGDDIDVVFHAKQGKAIDDPGIQAEIAGVLTQFAKQPHVGSTVSPFSPEGARQVAPNRTIAFGTLRLNQTVSDYKTSDGNALIAL